MKQNYNHTLAFDSAPAWAECTQPRRTAFRDIPSLLVISLPGESYLEIASRVAANEIADPRSAIGRVFREHCGLLSLPYVSGN